MDVDNVEKFKKHLKNKNYINNKTKYNHEIYCIVYGSHEHFAKNCIYNPAETQNHPECKENDFQEIFGNIIDNIEYDITEGILLFTSSRDF
ncbi:hypothetical protein PIROE2DRAFT_6602 [Piromyces sp. E2]|nr:hypothetical protein PIROE2DRAFT_6602 [Piromyces sp. E2]|eukprot:OUM66256.1 hypothetical protein PIROE2DRAFT_6602 [Piromyces sp. E2]